MKSFKKSPKKTLFQLMAFILLLVGTQTSFAQHAQLELGKIESNWWSSMWSKEVVNDAPAFIRIKNRWKSTNLHNEYKVLLVGETDNNWTSAMWALEPVSGASGYFRIKNRRTGTYIHNESGKVELGQIQPNWWSAMWLWEPVSGAPGFFRIKNRNTGTYLHNQNQKMSADDLVEVTLESVTQYKRAERGDKVGCPDGQINDPIDGGTCWTCPKGYKRTVFHIKSDKACERAASEVFAAAESHGRAKGLLGTDCAGGQFWDPNGNCYSCPEGYNRTAYSVTSAQACSKRVHADYKHAELKESAVKCGPGSFLDIGTQTCWTCPDGYARTVYPVDGEKACEIKQ